MKHVLLHRPVGYEHRLRAHGKDDDQKPDSTRMGHEGVEKACQAGRIWPRDLRRTASSCRAIVDNVGDGEGLEDRTGSARSTAARSMKELQIIDCQSDTQAVGIRVPATRASYKHRHIGRGEVRFGDVAHAKRHVVAPVDQVREQAGHVFQSVSGKVSSEVTKVPLAELRRLLVTESKLPEYMERKDRKKTVKCGKR